MFSLHRKRQITYAMIGIFFLLGGVEYAIIMPTLWMFLETQFQAPEYFLGLVLSSFCVADMIGGPILGRLSDRVGNTKLILLVANVPQIIGSLMYCIGLSPWFLVASRFIVGFGSSVGAALFADISRVTSEEKRTGVFSVFMMARQLGLMVGPGCNLFLRLIHFNVGSVVIDMFQVPGLFMACLWIIHEILVLFFFWNLPALHLQEQLEAAQQRREQSEFTGTTNTANNSEHPSLDPSGGGGGIQSQSLLDVSSTFTPGPTRTRYDNAQSTPYPHPIVSRRRTDQNDSAYLSSSNEFIEQAEHYIISNNYRRPEMASLNNAAAEEIRRSDALLQGRTYSPISEGGISENQRLTAGGNVGGLRINSYGSLYNESDASRDAQSSSLSNLVRYDDSASELSAARSLQSVGILGEVAVPDQAHPFSYYVNEFIREEVIAILMTVSIAFFNQMALETMITPLTSQFLGWDEIENSILFCVCAVEIIAVFLLVRLVLYRKLQDRTMILFGFILETGIIAFFIWFLGQANEGDAKTNLPIMLICIFVDLLGLPLLIVASSSLYSKITRKETQGLAQGVRRTFVGCGTILGPLWASSMLPSPYIMFSVMLAVNLIAMMMLLLSFNRLRIATPQRPASEHVDS